MSDGKIFISYRRADSAYAAGRLYDRLEMRFGVDRLFMDVEHLEPGINFVEAINKAVSECSVLIALIGPQWLLIQDKKGERRLENPFDFVRLEISTALERGIHVIPILLQGTSPPDKDQLPVSIQPLAELNALEIRHERFNADTDRLVRTIEKFMQKTGDISVKGGITPATGGKVHGTNHSPKRKEPILERMRTLPRGLWILSGGIGLVLALMLIFWGGNTFLTSPGDNETSQLRSTSQAILTLSNNPQPTEIAITTTPAPSVVEKQAVSQTLITDDFGVPMAMVPAGTFQMGADAEHAFTICREFRSDCGSDWFDDEEPIHTLSLDDFYIDQYEVTNARYAECVDADICDPPPEGNSQTRIYYYGSTDYADYPVIYVNWDDSQTYCAWRGARLPTEAEWERAAAGGIDAPLYPWGDENPLCDKKASNGAKYDDGSGCSGTDTEQVGSYSPNGYGIYDLAGNVWEWVADWYDADYYANSPGDNPQGPNDGKKRVVRSGSWDYFGYNLRVSNRFSSYPENRHNDLGFRCAKGAGP